MESTALLRQGHRLLQLGVALLVFAAFEGIVIPALPMLLVYSTFATLAAYVMAAMWGAGGSTMSAHRHSMAPSSR